MSEPNFGKTCLSLKINNSIFFTLFITNKIAYGSMRTICIYHSETGHTHAVMEELAKSVGAELIRVKDRSGYGKATMYLIGAPKAHMGALADIDPDTIDVAGYDLIIIGTPVWAFRPTPAANSIMKAIQNSTGKKVIIVCTSGGSPGETLPIMSERAAALGMDVISRHHISFTMRGVRDEEEITALKRAVWDLARS